MFGNFLVFLPIRLSGAELELKMAANSTYWKAKSHVYGIEQVALKGDLYWDWNSGLDIKRNILFIYPFQHGKHSPYQRSRMVNVSFNEWRSGDHRQAKKTGT